MRVANALIKSGYFWNAKYPDNKLPGTLRIENGGKIEIEVLGFFKKSESVSQPILPMEIIERVVGYADDFGHVTLTSVYFKGSSFGTIIKSSWFASKAYCGIGFEENEKIEFNSVQFVVDGLDEWLSLPVFETTINHETTEASIKYTPATIQLIKLNDEMTLEIDHSMSLPSISSLSEAKIIKHSFLRLKSSKPMPIESFTTIIYQILTFLTFAMDECVSLELVNAPMKIQTDTGEEEELIKIYYESHPFTEDPPKIDRSKFVFNYMNILGAASEKISKWLELYEKIKPTFDLYFSAKTGAYEYLDGKFLALVQSLESFHRRWNDETVMEDAEFASLVETICKGCPNDKLEWLKGRLQHGNEISLPKRLKSLLNQFSMHLNNSKNITKTVRKIADTRNYKTHFDSGLKERAATFEELIVITRLIEAIHKVLFLDLIGFSSAEISSLLHINYHIRTKLTCLD